MTLTIDQAEQLLHTVQSANQELEERKKRLAEIQQHIQQLETYYQSERIHHYDSDTIPHTHYQVTSQDAVRDELTTYHNHSIDILKSLINKLQ